VNRIEGNFPNPFNPQTTIRFSSASTGKVTIRIFNVGGQLVRTLSTKADAGANEVRWNGRRDDGQPIASGVYFYKVKFADGSESGSRMALVK
jgi:flagellar hook assembly protein FlgD